MAYDSGSHRRTCNISLIMESNPYTSPSANLFGSTSGTFAEGVPQEAITQLQGTKPWVRLIGVIMWIAVALMMFGGVAVTLAGVSGISQVTQGRAGGMDGAMVIGIAVGYMIGALLYIYPTVKIWKYGSCIGRLVNSRSPEDLVAALNQQRSFWKFIGILVLITIVIYVLIIAAAVLFGVAAGMKNAG